MNHDPVRIGRAYLAQLLSRCVTGEMPPHWWRLRLRHRLQHCHGSAAPFLLERLPRVLLRALALQLVEQFSGLELGQCRLIIGRRLNLQPPNRGERLTCGWAFHAAGARDDAAPKIAHLQPIGAPLRTDADSPPDDRTSRNHGGNRHKIGRAVHPLGYVLHPSPQLAW